MHTLQMTLTGTLAPTLLGALGGVAVAQSDDAGNGGFTLEYVEETGETQPRTWGSEKASVSRTLAWIESTTRTSRG